MLVARCRRFTGLVGRLDPVPSTIAMASQAPRVTQTRLIGRSTAKADHHSCSAACLTERSRVINTWRWLVTATVQLVPTEGRPLHTQAPDVINGLSTRVTSIHQKVRLREYDRMAVAPARR